MYLFVITVLIIFQILTIGYGINILNTTWQNKFFSFPRIDVCMVRICIEFSVSFQGVGARSNGVHAAMQVPWTVEQPAAAATRAAGAAGPRATPEVMPDAAKQVT